MEHEKFVEAVLKNFDYLQEDFGLRVIASRQYSVIFENPVVRVGIAWDKTRSYEFRVSVSTLKGGLSEFCLDEIVGCRGNSRSMRNRSFMACRDSDVIWCIEKMSEQLREFARDLLRGSAEGFSEMQCLRKKQAAEWQREEQERLARLKADVAWGAKDFVGVVSAYQSIESILSPAEKMKLAYARRRRLKPD